MNKLKRFALFLWVVFFLLLIFVLWLRYTHQIGISDLGGLLQGTVGVAATVISIVYLIRGIGGTEKQIVLASQQSYNQAQEGKARAHKTTVEWEKQRLDLALQGRLALVPRGTQAEPSVEIVAAHAEHLLRQCRSYLASCRSKNCVMERVRDIPQSVIVDRYVGHLKLVFQMALSADEEVGGNQTVDHVWQSLSLEERALAVVLIAWGETLPKPSRAALSTWEIAVDSFLPWDGRQVRSREFLT